MSYAFYCSKCKVSHAGECPEEPEAEVLETEFDELYAEYKKIPPDELKKHYLAAKQALIDAIAAENASNLVRVLTTPNKPTYLEIR